MKSVHAAIGFDNYIVKKVSFEVNDECTNEEIDIDVHAESDFLVSDDKKYMKVTLQLDIFKDAIKNNYPFEMQLIVEGFFRLINIEDDSNIEKYYVNALAILFPYARALVTTYTANSNVEPLILPPVNINKLVQKKETK